MGVIQYVFSQHFELYGIQIIITMSHLIKTPAIIIDLIMKEQQSDLYEVLVTYDRGNSTYKPEEMVTGSIRLMHKTASAFKVDIATLIIKPIGKLVMNNKQGNKKFETLIKQVSPIKMLDIEPIEIAKNKTLNETSQLAFRFKLAKGQHKYAETYVGVYISVTYEVEVHINLMNNPNSIHSSFPFYVQVPKQGRDTIQEFVYPKKKNFMIRSEDIKGNKVPKFKIRGELQSQICFMSQDLNGVIIVDQADSPIRSIDVQMYRVEKISSTSESITEKTEIQMIQMCDGNVTRNMQLPIYMILPRYYSCPSYKYSWCQLDFQIDLQIIFKDGFKVTVNIPLKLLRS